MTEPSIPFQGQTAVMDRPSAAPVGDAPLGADSGRRTRFLLLGGAAAVAVLGLLAYFLLFAGSEPVADEGQPVAPAPAAPAPEAEPLEPAQPLRLTAKNYGRDPFEPRIVEVVAPPAPVAPVVPAPVAPVTTPVGTPVLPGSTDGSGGTTEPETSVPTASPSHSFKVVEVAEDNKTVTVKVDGELYENLKAGEVFAQYFKVVLISGQVNSFQYGEEKFNVLGTKKLTIA